MVPWAAALLSAWLKVGIFNLPPAKRVTGDWFAWSGPQAAGAAVSSLATLLLLFSPLLLLRPRARYLGAWTLNLLITLLAFADLIHRRYYHDVLSMGEIALAWQAALITSSIHELVRGTDFLVFADIVAAFALFRLYVRYTRLGAFGREARAAVRTVLAGALLLVLPITIVARDSDGVFEADYFRNFSVRRIGLLNTHLHDLGRRFVRVVRRKSRSPADIARVNTFLDEWTPRASAPSALFGAAKGANLIVLVVEALQAFPVGLEIDGQPVMPTLSALAKRSLTFPRFYSQAWYGKSSDGEFTALQSLHPLADGSVPSMYLSNSFRGLPAVLAEHGYSTASACAYLGAIYHMREMHARLGFQQSFFLETYKVTTVVGMGMADADFFRQTVPHLAALPRPFMAYMLTLATHHPFKIPPELKSLHLGDLETTMLGKYLQTVRYFDGALKDLLQQLEEAGLLDNTVIAIYGDHREDSLEPEALERVLTHYAGYPPRSLGFDARYWSEENRIPFIVHLPHDRGAGSVAVSGGHLDVTPTLLNLLGISDWKMPALGRDLTNGENQPVVLRNGSFVIGDDVCVTPTASASTATCGNMTTGAALEPARFAQQFEVARERLEVSDLILKDDLILELGRKLRPRAAAAPDPRSVP
jgi:phosphoglycerol transferase MdoB-like AlkP superfamily enzyme